MPNKKNKKWFFTILIILFIIFMGYYVAINSGYYESNLRAKTHFTQEQIKQFEEDVKLGKKIDTTKYIENETIDYSNKVSQTGLNISLKAEEVVDYTVKKIVDIITFLFN